jgi:hypothetical protein
MGRHFLTPVGIFFSIPNGSNLDGVELSTGLYFESRNINEQVFGLGILSWNLEGKTRILAEKNGIRRTKHELGGNGMRGNLPLAVFSPKPKPCSTKSASIMQGAQNHIVGDQMMFGIFVRVSAFVFVLRVSS